MLYRTRPPPEKPHSGRLPVATELLPCPPVSPGCLSPRRFLSIGPGGGRRIEIEYHLIHDASPDFRFQVGCLERHIPRREQLPAQVQRVPGGSRSLHRGAMSGRDTGRKWCRLRGAGRLTTSPSSGSTSTAAASSTGRPSIPSRRRICSARKRHEPTRKRQAITAR